MESCDRNDLMNHHEVNLLVKITHSKDRGVEEVVGNQVLLFHDERWLH